MKLNSLIPHLRLLIKFYFGLIRIKILAIFNYPKLLEKFKNYNEINLLSAENIGNVYLQLDIALNSRNKKNIIITQDFDEFCIPYIAEILKKKINIIFSTKLFLLVQRGSFLKNKINKITINSYKLSTIKDVTRSIIAPTEKKKIFLKNISQKIIPSKKIQNLKNKKIIFYSCRDSFFKNDKGFNSFRSSNIKNSYLGLKYLKKKYTTIRVGHYKFKKTNLFKQYKIQNIIERNKLEAYIAEKCLFAIVGVSGIQTLPMFFEKPLLIHNFIGINRPPVIKSGIIIPKILTYQNGDIISIKDFFIKKKFVFEYDRNDGQFFPFYKVNIGALQSDSGYKKLGVTYTDNTEDEILNGMMEMEKYFVYKKKLDINHIKLDQKFKKLFPRNHWIRDSKVLISYYWLKKYLHLYEIN